MKSHIEKQKFSKTQSKPVKGRFKIERLEERIAPHHKFGHGKGGCGHGGGCHR